MIQVNLDVMMAKRKISLNDLAKKMDLSLANLSILKNNKCRAIRFSTLSSLCRILECDVSDILVYVKGEEPNGTESNLD
ncbi:MAG: helix-turn-helix domain-containing protein [Clostridiaceae bacterium]